ncbi:hypothetical protein EPN87_04325 [archaeon]|nr:MAG: hypothetical protein EPN87_04325 [archaeon]
MGLRKKIRDILQLGPRTLLGYHKTILECPKCGHRLNQHVAMTQLYACENCGYQGPIALEPKRKKD